jgi:hypothetical protein
VGEISRISVIARGVGIRRRGELDEAYGSGQWRKLKGVAMVRLPGGELVRCEVHWYEAHGVGRRRMKIKRFLD